MTEKDLENLMEIAISDYEIARKNRYDNLMEYNRGKIIAYNQIAIILGFEMQVDYIRELDEYKVIHE